MYNEKCSSDGHVLWSTGKMHSEVNSRTTQYEKMKEDMGEGGEKKIK
jgi:hypothetical protein